MATIYRTEGRDLAKKLGCRFIETSAKQRINVDEAFSDLVREIRKYNKVRLASNLWGNLEFIDPFHWSETTGRTTSLAQLGKYHPGVVRPTA